MRRLNTSRCRDEIELSPQHWGIVMRWRLIGAFVAIPVALTVSGCATPETLEACSVNYTNRNVAIGAIGGAAAGVGIAAIAQASGGAFAAAAVGGAVVGAIAGAVVGQKQDEACRQLARKRALDEAAEAERARRVAAATAAATAPPPPAEHRSVAWTNPRTNNSGSVTPLGPVAGETAEAVCMSYVDQQIVAGKTESVTARACRGPDGVWKPVA